MKKLFTLLLIALSINSYSQTVTIDKMVKEATENSQLEQLAHELFDLIGPRLVGTPQMKNVFHLWSSN